MVRIPFGIFVMTLDQEFQFFSQWTEEHRAMLANFNLRYKRGYDVSNHPLINPQPTPTLARR